MNWIFAFLLGWHTPLEIPPIPPLDWPHEETCCDWSSPYFTFSLADGILMAPAHEVLRVKTTSISIPGAVIVAVTPEQMAILESAYPPEQVYCDEDITFYAPGK